MQASIDVMPVFEADSITNLLSGHHHFFLCNRLFLLNLATINTTGFENPDTARIILELGLMLKEVEVIYHAYQQSFATFPLSNTYTQLFEGMQKFLQQQPAAYAAFDHFTFLQQYVNPLFLENQRLIKQYGVVSKSYVDYSLTKNEVPIFSKRLYNGQNAKGVFLRVQDPQALAEIDRLGKLLFFDPILSANNERSCASCHNPAASFADHASTSLQFNGKDVLPRNTPSLINAGFNHLLMADGKHITLLHQAAEVTSNPQEMASNREEVLKKILSCKEYKKSFTRLLVFTPQEKEINLDHIFSAITSYYSKLNHFEAPFDAAMNERKAIAPEVQKGFNLFMSKAQCATCHFAPIFNGVKPPYVGSEFEVLGVPADTLFTKLSPDKGRYEVNPADETLYAFRTGTIRNAALTAPYMHNGVFVSLDEVLEFYNKGGGAGKGLDVPNQTLSGDSLRLTETEKKYLVAFINSLNELIPQEQTPGSLPQSSQRELNKRKPGGSY